MPRRKQSNPQPVKRECEAGGQGSGVTGRAGRGRGALAAATLTPPCPAPQWTPRTRWRRRRARAWCCRATCCWARTWSSTTAATASWASRRTRKVRAGAGPGRAGLGLWGAAWPGWGQPGPSVLAAGAVSLPGAPSSAGCGEPPGRAPRAAAWAPWPVLLRAVSWVPRGGVPRAGLAAWHVAESVSHFQKLRKFQASASGEAGDERARVPRAPRALPPRPVPLSGRLVRAPVQPALAHFPPAAWRGAREAGLGGTWGRQLPRQWLGWS